jgi:exonuclease SbcC
MIPITLKLSGFLSYREPVTIDFTGFDLATISGSNGAGKSTLLDAITWALFGQARRKDDAIIHTKSDAAEVTFDFEYENQRYRVQRSKPRNKTAILEFFIRSEVGWRPLTEHSLRETEARLQSILRLDYETFTNASFFLQGKADQFAQQRPGDRKRILSTILGLEVWDAYRDEAAARRKVQETEQVRLDAQIREYQLELDQEPSRKAYLAQVQAELEQRTALVKANETVLEHLRMRDNLLREQRKIVDMLARGVESVRARLTALDAQIATRCAERDEYLRQVEAAAHIEAAYRRWQADRAELERWNDLATDFHQAENALSVPRQAIAQAQSRLEQELAGLLEQRAQAEKWSAQLPQLSAEISQVFARITELEMTIRQREQLAEEEQTLRQTIADAQAQNKQLKDEMDRLIERIGRLKEAEGAECELCGRPLSPQDREALIQTLQLDGKGMGDRYRANLTRMGEHQNRMKEIQENLASFKQNEAELRQQEQKHIQLLDRREQVTERIEAWQSAGGLRLDAVEEMLINNDYAHEARVELAQMEAALRELGYDAAAHDSVLRAEQAGRATEAQMQALAHARAALAPLEREIAGLQADQVQQQADLAAKQAEHRQADDKYQQEAANPPDVEKAEDELFRLKTEESQLRMKVGAAAQAVEVLKNLRTRQAELSAERSAVQSQIARLKSLERAFSKDGIPALLIEQALPEIEEQANAILQRLTNGVMSVRFDTQREYKDRSREDKRETLDILISDGSGQREYEMFSGGEAFRVNFAIRLALSRVLAQRAGARLQTLVIDEGFGSQDTEGRQRLLEAINLVRADFSKILIITHLEELKDAFPARIEVEKGLTGSKVRVIQHE